MISSLATQAVRQEWCRPSTARSTFALIPGISIWCGIHEEFLATNRGSSDEHMVLDGRQTLPMISRAFQIPHAACITGSLVSGITQVITRVADFSRLSSLISFSSRQSQLRSVWTTCHLAILYQPFLEKRSEARCFISSRDSFLSIYIRHSHERTAFK